MLRPLTRVELRPEDRAEVRLLLAGRSVHLPNAHATRQRRPHARLSQHSTCFFSPVNQPHRVACVALP